jgi:hypothetical protein
MTTTINASTSAGLVQTADTSGVLALQTAGTTAVTVDASQNVGVGVTPNAGWTTSTGKVIDLTGNSSLYGFSSGGTFSTMLGSNAYYDGSTWRAKTTGSASLLQLTGGNLAVQMAASASAGAAISFTAVLTNQGIGQTLALQGGTSSAGAGIAFPATQSASSDVNTLDDYEEGTWTPVVTIASGTLNSQSCSGFFVKTGSQVTVTFDIIANTTSAFSPTISGLPFTSKVGSPGSAGALRELSLTGLVWAGILGSGTTAFALYRYDNNSTLSNGANRWTGSLSYIATN